MTRGTERKRLKLVAQIVDDPQFKDNSEAQKKFKELKERAKTIELDESTYYIQEGDLLLDEDELYLYAIEQQLKNAQAKAGMQEVSGLSQGLVGIQSNGKIVRWKPDLKLSYCVLEKSFSNKANYELVCENMKKATKDWENTCGVSFEHKDEFDSATVGTKPEEVLFVVREIQANGKFIAMAFFPHQPAERRRVLIDPSYYGKDLRFDKVGVLRHELGHVLGFRHEHIRSGAPSECPGEDTSDTIDLTKYDPSSVMHYFCGGVGTKELAITGLDRNGAQTVYGKPLSELLMVD